MNIYVQSALGQGPTELAAFDDALHLTNIHNFNLLRLSSVIPPGAAVSVAENAVRPEGAWGDRLYVVYAEQREARPHVGAWAGVGWVQKADGSGLLVEHEGESEQDVNDLIDVTLAYMVEQRGDGGYGPIQKHVAGGACDGQPVCAFVCAAFQTEAW